MIAAEAATYESFIIAGAELSKAGVEYISGLGMFVGTGGLSPPASAVVAAQATLDLTVAGTCAVAGVAFGGIAGNAEFAYNRDSAQGSGEQEYKTKKKVNGKQKDDVPSEYKGEKPYKGESGKDAAKRVLEEHGKYDPNKTGPGSDFNKLKKYFDTHFE